MSIEAMKLALGALTLVRKRFKSWDEGDTAIGELRTAIQQAEAQQVENSTATGEPVAWVSTDSIGERYLCFTKPFDDPYAKPLVHPTPSVPDDVVRDAERYRWLRQHQLLAKINYMPTPSGEDLDAAIDAAMLAAKEK